MCVAGAPAPAVSRTPKAAQVSESGCVVEVVAAGGCSHGEREGELIARIIKGFEWVSISGEGAPAPDLPFVQIGFRSLAAVGLLFSVSWFSQGDRPAPTLCSQFLGASLLAVARAFSDRQRLRAWHGQRLRFLLQLGSTAWRVPPSAARYGRAALLKTVDCIRSKWWGGYDTRDDDWGTALRPTTSYLPRDRA